jgi:hypothetical protein
MTVEIEWCAALICIKDWIIVAVILDYFSLSWTTFTSIALFASESEPVS